MVTRGTTTRPSPSSRMTVSTATGQQPAWDDAVVTAASTGQLGKASALVDSLGLAPASARTAERLQDLLVHQAWSLDVIHLIPLASIAAVKESESSLPVPDGACWHEASGWGDRGLAISRGGGGAARRLRRRRMRRERCRVAA